MATMAVRDQILRGAQKLFQEKGLGKISMEDVARHIGKGKSTLYYYFKSKDELFSAVMDMEIDEIIRETIRQLNSCNSFQEKLETFGKVKFEMIRRRKTLYTTMENRMGAEERLQYTLIKKNVHAGYVQKEKLVLLQVFLEAIANKQIRAFHGEQLDTIILVFLAALRGVNREILVHGQTDNTGRLIGTYCALFRQGLV
ncbi:MAG: TetR/AcrR family transcriptional regulator [Flavihumibacter sp.]